MALLAALHHLRNRPALVLSAAFGVAVALGTRTQLPGLTATLVGWSCGVAAYLIAALRMASLADADLIRRRAELLDEGGLTILFVVVGAAVASVAAIVMELVQAKGSVHSGLSAALAACTVVLSWMFLHTVFAFHYAHEFYNDDGSTHHRCLEFPGTETPLYWDFLYFSFIAGMTTQVADVITKSVEIRRLVLAHSVISFFFNTAIIALGVNIGASLLG